MNKNSYICNFIKDNPSDWDERLMEKKIDVSVNGNIAIFNYGFNADFYDAVVQEARGIIIDIRNLEVVCWPFRKFGNYQEGYADIIDWESAKVQEKMDGSIIKLYFHDDRWVWATNSTMDANDAEVSGAGRTFMDLIKSTPEYQKIDTDKLNPDHTYIFELISSENKVVIQYPYPKLVLIGQRDNRTGQETVPFIPGVQRPKEYKLSSLEDCISAVKELNKDTVMHEGFVVVDKDYNRIKIKSPEYLIAHKLRSHINNKERILELIRSGMDMEGVIKDFPEATEEIRWYQYQIARLHRTVDEVLAYSRNLWEELSHDRKAFAITVKDSRYKAFMFYAIDNPDTDVLTVMDSLSGRRLGGLIEDYKREEIFNE